MFAEDLLVIDGLRTDAMNVREPHVSGISRLVVYAAQLKWMGGKFPIDVSYGRCGGCYPPSPKRGESIFWLMD